MLNQYIDKFLDYYIQLENPKYAVLLKGKAGSGKTYYINRYKEQLTKQDQKYIYLSLYSVNSYDELQINSKDSILIFDDLEQCSMDIAKLLGYINYFVEHEFCKVILIINEDELKRKEEYRKIKDRLVGQTFEFSMDIESAFNSFLEELKNTNSVKEDILEKYKDIVLTIFRKSNCDNLSILRQSIFSFERFYDLVLKKFFQNEALIKDTLKWFFIFYFEFREGNKEVFQLDRLQEDRLKDRKYEYFLDKYSFNEHLDLIIPFEIWKEILVDSYIDIEKINTFILNSRYFFDETTSLWKKIYAFYNLEDEEFEKLLNELYSKFSGNQYKSFQEVKMVSSLLLYFKEKELIDRSYERILYDIKKSIDYVFEKYILDEDLMIQSYDNLFNTSFCEGFRYYNSKNFKEIENYILKKIEQKQKYRVENDLKDIVASILQNESKKLYDLLHHTTVKKISYCNKPIFKDMDIAAFVSSIRVCNNQTLQHLSYIFKKRYENFADKLLLERKFLENLKLELEDLLNSKKGKLSGYFFKNFVENIEASIERLVNEELNRIQKT